MTSLDFEAVQQARQRIRDHVHRTPVVTSSSLDAELGLQVFFKCENLQRVGAFKARGAVNAVMSLDPVTAPRGVVTHSSGNHAAALAYAARLRGIRCHVVMPKTASPIKIAAVRRYQAELVFCDEPDREATCAAVARDTRATVVPPFDYAPVIAGQGTAALELIEEIAGLDVLIAPVGGGGLLSGTAITAAHMTPRTLVVGAEPQACDDAARSLASGVRQPAVPSPRTWADGLRTALGTLNFDLLRRHSVRIVTVSEPQILAAALTVLERLKLVVEPSSATVLAAIGQAKDEWRGKRVGAILSGGNTDFAWLADAIAARSARA